MLKASGASASAQICSSFLSKARPIESSLAGQALSIGWDVERAGNQRQKFYSVTCSNLVIDTVSICIEYWGRDCAHSFCIRLGHRITCTAICITMRHELYQRCRSLWQICALCWDTKRWEGARELTPTCSSPGMCQALLDIAWVTHGSNVRYRETSGNKRTGGIGWQPRNLGTLKASMTSEEVLQAIEIQWQEVLKGHTLMTRHGYVNLCSNSCSMYSM